MLQAAEAAAAAHSMRHIDAAEAAAQSCMQQQEHTCSLG
jgi:hypothetical protein